MTIPARRYAGMFPRTYNASPVGLFPGSRIRRPKIEEVTEQPPSARARFCASSPTAIEGGMWDTPAALRFWHLASFDAPTVAMVWAAAFAWAARVRPQTWIFAVLGLVAWTVYVADRLLDARKAIQTGQFASLRDRHRFHWRNRRILIPLAIAAAFAAALAVAVLLPASARAPDALVGAAAAFYFAGVHSESALAPERVAATPMAGKEFLVGALFAAACALPAWGCLGSHGEGLLLAAVFFAALAWLNCHAIARWEDGAEARDVFRDAIRLGLAGLAAGALACAADLRLGCLLWLGAAAALLLALLDRLRGRMTPLALRALADLVLLTPLALLLKYYL